MARRQAYNVRLDKRSPGLRALALRALPPSRWHVYIPRHVLTLARPLYLAIRLRARLIRCPALAPCAVGRGCVRIRS